MGREISQKKKKKILSRNVKINNVMHNEIVELIAAGCCRTKGIKSNEKLIEERSSGGH